MCTSSSAPSVWLMNTSLNGRQISCSIFSHCLMGWLHEVWVQHLQHWKCISMYSRQKKKKRCFTTGLVIALGWFRTLILHLPWTGWRSFTCHRPRWCIIDWINIPVLCYQPTNLIFSYDIPTKQTCLLVCVCFPSYTVPISYQVSQYYRTTQPTAK